MRVKVQTAFNGSLRQMLTFHVGGQQHHEYVRGETWGRKQAKEALDMLQYVYHLNRRNIRFCTR